MDCELCYRTYNVDQDDNRLPKVLKACPHTYCQECLLKIKETTGKVHCPVCSNSPTQEDDPLPTNEALLKAIDHKREE